MKVIIGLGNPGREYEQTRHNAGFLIVDEIAKELNISISTKKFKALIGEGIHKGEKIILVKPQTFMNLSGESASTIMNFYNLKPSDFLVIYDDLDLTIGKLRLREKGSAGGQNGVKSLIQHLKTQEFDRIRVGIDKDTRMATADYVLGKFREDQKQPFEEAKIEAVKATLTWMNEGMDKAMNLFNKK